MDYLAGNVQLVIAIFDLKIYMRQKKAILIMIHILV